MNALVLIAATLGLAANAGPIGPCGTSEAGISKTSRVYLRTIEVKDLTDPEPGDEDEVFFVVYRYGTNKEAKARRVTGGKDDGYSAKRNTKLELDSDVQIAEAELEPGQFVEYLVCGYEDDDNMVSQLTEAVPWLTDPVERGHEVVLEKVGIKPNKLRGGSGLYIDTLGSAEPQAAFLQETHEVYEAIANAADTAPGDRVQFLGSFVFRLAREGPGEPSQVDHLVLEVVETAGKFAKRENTRCSEVGDTDSKCGRLVMPRVTLTKPGCEILVTLGLGSSDRAH
jgi:hypothetical protein